MTFIHENKTSPTLILIVTLVALYTDFVRSEAFNVIFPKADKFYEEEFWSYHKRFSLINALTSNWVCKLSMVDKAKLCIRVLEFLKSSPLTVVGDPVWNPKEFECSRRTAVLEELSDKKLIVKMFRCPVKFSFKRSDTLITVGGMDPKTPGFYLTRGISKKSVFVLHDKVEVTHKTTVDEVQKIAADDKVAVDHTTADPKTFPQTGEIDRISDVQDDNSKVAPDFLRTGTGSTGAESHEKGSEIKSKEDDSSESASVEVDSDVIFVDVDDEVFVSNLLVKIPKGLSDYKIMTAPRKLF